MKALVPIPSHALTLAVWSQPRPRRRRLLPGAVARPIRWLGAIVLLAMPTGCAFCVHDPINPQARDHTAFCAEYYHEGKYTEAEARCRLAREFAPKYAEPVNLLGLIEYSRGHPDQARQYFKDALALKQDFAEAHNNLGAVSMQRREYKDAIDSFEQALAIDPGYVNARVNVALCHLYQGHADRARDEYVKCLELQPKACDCRQGLGVLAAGKRDFEEAKLQFTRMSEVCPESPTGFYNLCQTLLDMGQCGNALESCMKALAVQADHIEARRNLTAATECLALEDTTIREYSDKIKRNPGNAELHFNLGVIYADKRLVEAALNEFLNAIKLKEDYAMAHYRAARLYDELVRTDDTIAACQKFVDLLRGNKLAEQRDWCIQRVKELQYH